MSDSVESLDQEWVKIQADHHLAERQDLSGGFWWNEKRQNQPNSVMLEWNTRSRF